MIGVIGVIGVRQKRNLIKGLQDLCEYIPIDNITMVEVGSYVGESTMIFAASSKIISIHCIDPWVNGFDDKDGASKKYPMSEVEAQFDATVKATNKVFKHKMTSIEASKLFCDGVLDMVYIDGCHQYESVLEDILLWYPKVKDGGIIAGHDYVENNTKYRNNVVKAVNELLGTPEKVFRDSSWIFTK